MNKKIISAFLSLTLIFSAFSSFADESSALSEAVKKPVTEATVDDNGNSAELTESDVHTDSSANVEVNVESDAKDAEPTYVDAKQKFLSYKSTFLSDVEKALVLYNENVITKRYRFPEIYMGISTCKYVGGAIYNDENKPVDESMCQEILGFLNRLYDVIGDNIEFEYVTEEEIEHFNKEFDKETKILGTDPSIRLVRFLIGLSGIELNSNFLLRGNWLKMPRDQYYYVSDVEEIWDYVAENFFGDENHNIGYKLNGEFNDLTYSRNRVQYLDYENKLYRGEPVDIIDKLTFELKLTEQHKGSFFDFLGDTGTIVKCRIVQTVGVETNHSRLRQFVLTAEGCNGTMEFADQAPSNWGYEGTSNFMDFGPMRITGVTQANSVRSVAVTLHRLGNYVLFDSVPTQNMNYEFYYAGNETAERKAMYKLFGIQKGDFYISSSPTQDPENYVTPMRHTYELGGESYSWDYYINFVAVMPIDASSKALPDWYLALGDDVTATIVGIAATLNDKDYACYTMVRFAGSKKSVWFDISSGSHQIDWTRNDYTADDNLEMKLVYSSLLSFDGNEKVKDTVNKKSFEATIDFSHEDFDIESIEFDFGVVTDKVTADEINYIGGGKDIYAKFM